MSYRYKIAIDINKDAWNWYGACNSVGHGVDWKQRIDSDVAEKIHGKTESEAYEFLVPYLKQKYEDEAEMMELGEDFIRKRFETHFLPACEKLIEITGKPLYRDDFTVYLTTFPRGPYNYERGEFWLGVFWTNPIANFMHETLHFQFIRFWRENKESAVSKLSDDKFEYLKESLTIVLDESLVPLIEVSDKGYESHEEYRKKLHSFWTKNKNFDELVKYGVKILDKYC